jgi:hypothetical protein
MTDASLLGANFQLAEVLPSQLGVPKLNDSSVVLAKQVSTYFPQTSQSQTIAAGTSGSPFIFKLSNSRMYADLRSSRLNFTAVMQPDAGVVAFDDSAMSLINRIRVLVGGVLVSDIQYANVVASLKHNLCYPMDNTVDQLIAGYKYNTTQLGEQTLAGTPAGLPGAANYNIPVAGGNATASYQDPFSSAAARQRGGIIVNTSCNDVNNTVDVSIPLRLISNFFNQKQFFYLRNASIQLEIYPEVPAQALAVISGAPTAGGTAYAMNQMTLRQDEYSVDSSVVDMIDQVIASAGLVVPYEDVTVLTSSYNGTTQAVPFTRSVSDLTELLFTAQPTANFNSLNAFSCSGFPTYQLDQCQVQIGATLYPVTPTTSDTERNYLLLQMANGDPAAEYSTCMVPRKCLAVYNNAFAGGAYTADSQMCISAIGYPFRKINTEGVFSISCGTSTSLDSGSIVVKFIQGAAQATTAYCILKYVRLLTLASGRVSVSA